MRNLKRENYSGESTRLGARQSSIQRQKRDRQLTVLNSIGALVGSIYSILRRLVVNLKGVLRVRDSFQKVPVDIIGSEEVEAPPQGTMTDVGSQGEERNREVD